jgi:cephalosporin hydroxylase
MEALKLFLKENKKFKSDKDMEKFLVTFNPKGYLLKVK